MVDPLDLPHDHPARNKPLMEVGAELKWKHNKKFRPVTAAMHIAKNTFNELGPVWTDYDDWRISDGL